MSSINFETTQSLHPELRQVAASIKRWMAAHTRRRYLDALTLVRDLSGEASPSDVIKFLSVIESSGAEVEYRVLSPFSNQLVDERFDKAEDVPDELVDDLGRPFEVLPDMIVPVYRVR